jgi:hypothetical protein
MIFEKTDLLQIMADLAASVLSQTKRGYAGLAAVEGSNPANGLSTRSLNRQVDTTASMQPEFKKAIFQGGDGLIDKDISVLVSGS